MPLGLSILYIQVRLNVINLSRCHLKEYFRRGYKHRRFAHMNEDWWGTLGSQTLIKKVSAQVTRS